MNSTYLETIAQFEDTILGGSSGDFFFPGGLNDSPKVSEDRRTRWLQRPFIGGTNEEVSWLATLQVLDHGGRKGKGLSLRSGTRHP